RFWRRSTTAIRSACTRIGRNRGDSDHHRQENESSKSRPFLILHSKFEIRNFMSSKKQPTTPPSREYDHLAFVPEKFGGTMAEPKPERPPRRVQKSRRPY